MGTSPTPSASNPDFLAHLRRDHERDARQRVRRLERQLELEREREREIEVAAAANAWTESRLREMTRTDRPRAARLRQLQEPAVAAAEEAGINFGEYQLELDLLRRLGDQRRGRTGEEAGVGTMGIGWGTDGRSL